MESTWILSGIPPGNPRGFDVVRVPGESKWNPRRLFHLKPRRIEVVSTWTKKCYIYVIRPYILFLGYTQVHASSYIKKQIELYLKKKTGDGNTSVHVWQK